MFVVSDFFATGYQKALAVAGRRHDTIVIRMGDPRERELPAVGYLELEDAETGERLTVNVSDPAFREAFSRDVTDTRTVLEREFRKTGIDAIEIQHRPPVC